MSDDTPDPAQLPMFEIWVDDESLSPEEWRAATIEHIKRFELPRARHTDPETSHQAAESMVEGAASQRAEIMRVLHVIYEVGQTRPSETQGMTADDLDEYIGWRATTAGRRLIELERQGLVERTDEKRKTRSGRWAYVWRAR